MATSPSAPAVVHLPDRTATVLEQVWQWLRQDSIDVVVAAGAAVLLYLVMVALRNSGCRLLARGTAEGTWRMVLARVARRTHSLFLAAVAAHLVAAFASPPRAVAGAIGFVFTVAAVVQGAIWLRELILLLIARRAQGAGEDGSALSNAIGVIRVLVNVAVWAVALILVLDNLGVNVTALVAGLGIGGIAIGLAAQGIFADLFAALAIIFDRPFRRGDTIQYGTTIGTVEAIGLKTTRLRALSGEQVVMANTKLLEQEVRNLRLIDDRRVQLMLPLAPNTPADKLAAVPELLQQVVEQQAATRFDHARLVGITANSIDVELVFFLADPEGGLFVRTRHDVLVEAMRALHTAGMVLADLTPPRG